MMQPPQPPGSEQELLARAALLQGRTLQQLANELGVRLPATLHGNKGLTGQLLERWLGADASNRAEPDFVRLGVELKSLPIRAGGKPAESTFVTMVPLSSPTSSAWEASSVYQKLRRVLWVPVESPGAGRALADLYIGSPILWSPDTELEAELRADWEELSELICLGRLEEISAELGTWLQIRPKAANARVLVPAIGAGGESTQTLPRAFYLRARFTERWVLNGT